LEARVSKFIIEGDDNGDYCRVLYEYRGYSECDQCGGNSEELVVEWSSETGYDILESFGCYGGVSEWNMSPIEAMRWAMTSLSPLDGALVASTIHEFEEWRQSESPSASVGSGGEA
jgi:hypothetical protein